MEDFVLNNFLVIVILMVFTLLFHFPFSQQLSIGEEGHRWQTIPIHLLPDWLPVYLGHNVMSQVDHFCSHGVRSRLHLLGLHLGKSTPAHILVYSREPEMIRRWTPVPIIASDAFRLSPLHFSNKII